MTGSRRGSAQSRSIVIDTDIFRAAGGDPALPVPSGACTKVLNAVLTICHTVVVSAAGYDEFNEHRSIFAARWLTAMFARKKVTAIDLRNLDTQRSEWSAGVGAIAASAVVAKDAHVVAAALQSDKRILSMDEEARGYYRQVAQKAKALRGIAWVNPVRDHEDAIGWLGQGAPLDAKRTLGGLAT